MQKAMYISIIIELKLLTTIGLSMNTIKLLLTEAQFLLLTKVKFLKDINQITSE